MFITNINQRLRQFVSVSAKTNRLDLKPIIKSLIFFYSLIGILLGFLGLNILCFLVLYTTAVSVFFVFLKAKIEHSIQLWKTLSLIELMGLSYRQLILNRDYLRLKNFWIKDFPKASKKVKIGHLIWQIPLILSISFYTLLITRLKFALVVFFSKCVMLIALANNPIGWVYLICYFGPLLLLTALAGFPPLSQNLKNTYGSNTLRKLGFNIIT